MMVLDGPGEMARQLKRVMAALPETDRAATHAAGEFVWEETKAILGSYQPAQGPFEGWAPLAAVTMEERAEQGYPEDEPLRRQGLLHDNIEMSSDETGFAVGVPSRMVQHEYSDESVDIGAVAADLEFGTTHMPPRSFIGSTMFRCAESATAIMGSIYAAALAGLALKRR